MRTASRRPVRWSATWRALRSRQRSCTSPASGSAKRSPSCRTHRACSEQASWHPALISSRLCEEGAMSIDSGATIQQAVYVYEGPVRLWHWVNALAIIVLALSGYFIGSPLPSLSGEASDHFLMGYVRFVHFAAGYVL